VHPPLGDAVRLCAVTTAQRPDLRDSIFAGLRYS